MEHALGVFICKWMHISFLLVRMRSVQNEVAIRVSDSGCRVLHHVTYCGRGDGIVDASGDVTHLLQPLDGRFKSANFTLHFVNLVIFLKY